MLVNSFIKSIEFGMPSPSSGSRLVANEKQRHFSFPGHQLHKNWFLVLLHTKEKERDESQFVTNYLGIRGSPSGLRQFLTTKSPLKMMKNAFYSTLKALFVLKIFKFLSWVFGYV